MTQSKNSPPRGAADLILALRIMSTYVATKPAWPPTAPSAAQMTANADALDAGQATLEVLNAQVSAESSAQQERIAIGSGYFCGVRDEIYHEFGTDSDELLQAGLQKWDSTPTTPTEPPHQPVIRSVEEVTPTSCKIKIEVTPTAKDYKYFMGTTADTAAMTLKDTSSKTTFIYEGLTEGTKYFFAVKARNAAGESAFSAVVNRRTF